MVPSQKPFGEQWRSSALFEGGPQAVANSTSSSHLDMTAGLAAKTVHLLSGWESECFFSLLNGYEGARSLQGAAL